MQAQSLDDNKCKVYYNLNYEHSYATDFRIDENLSSTVFVIFFILFQSFHAITLKLFVSE